MHFKDSGNRLVSVAMQQLLVRGVRRGFLAFAYPCFIRVNLWPGVFKNNPLTNRQLHAFGLLDYSVRDRRINFPSRISTVPTS